MFSYFLAGSEITLVPWDEDSAWRELIYFIEARLELIWRLNKQAFPLKPIGFLTPWNLKATHSTVFPGMSKKQRFGSTFCRYFMARPFPLWHLNREGTFSKMANLKSNKNRQKMIDVRWCWQVNVFATVQWVSQWNHVWLYSLWWHNATSYLAICNYRLLNRYWYMRDRHLTCRGR